MPKQTSWTKREPDGVKREVRVTHTAKSIKWQFKRADDERWDYDSDPRPEDWDSLEDILTRRTGRGRQENVLKNVKRFRAGQGA